MADFASGARGGVGGGLASSSVTATFVFTDLVDSTAIAVRLGPEAAEALRQTHFRLLRGAVSASGGVEVKNLGDGLMVMYSSPSRALAGTVGMQQAIDRHNRSAEQLLGVRVGVSAGEAVEEDGDFFGDPVVEAARLCAHAEGGQILATDLVRSLVGRHATQTLVEVGPVALKGLPEPVDAVEVLWEPAKIEGSVPLPGRLVGAASDALFGFFGRGRELGVLAETRKQAHSLTRSQMVLVAGEPGMGKTALVAQDARVAHEQGTVVLFGHADEDLGVAYQPWIEVLATLVREGDPGLVEGLPSAQRGALGRFMPGLLVGGDRVGDPDTERLLLLEATTALLAVASQQQPVLVVFDDLHWADTASLQLLRHVTASTKPMDVMVVCTFRDTDLHRGDALTKLLADLHREANVTRISLAGLEDTAVIDLMEAAAGHALDAAGIGLAHALRRETDGNPFFTVEILRHLGETGQIAQGHDGRWTVDSDLDELSLPPSIHDVIGQRVERLGDEALRVLRLGAVIGREFDLAILAAVAGLDEDPLLDLMDTAAAAAVLTECDMPDRYRFAHALIQHSLYDELSPARRQRAHQRVAEALEGGAASDDAATLAELARHWVAATRPTNLDKAIHYVRRAGDAARDALAPADAVRWYEQALDLIGRGARTDEHRRAQLLAALGTVQRQASQPEFRDTLLAASALAEQLGDREVLIQAALGFTQMAAGQVGDEAAKPVIRAALASVDPNAAATRARLLAGLMGAYDASVEWRDRLELAREAVAVARFAEDDAAFVEVIKTTFLSLATPDNRDQEIDDVERAVAIADRIGDPGLQCNIRFPLAWARWQCANIDGAAAVIHEMDELAEKLGLPYQRWTVALLRTGALLLSGRADVAEPANQHALEIGMAAGIPEALGSFGGTMYLIREHQGRVDEMAQPLIDAARDNPSLAALRAIVPLMLCGIGRIEEARVLLRAEADRGFDFPGTQTYLSAMGALTEAAAITRDEGSARDLIERLAPFASHVIGTGASVNGAIARPLARAAAMLGDYEEAEQWFAIAHDIHTKLQAPYWTALGQLDHADLCLARLADGDIERARQLATIAAATAAEYGCGGLTQRADLLLADL
jgi:class 3 adenylate cyclase/tetratricopeptide (TPR) repeat protein